jgi:aryl carrier-like protein
MQQNHGRIAYFEAKADLLQRNAEHFAREGRPDDAIKAGIDMVRAMAEATRLRIGLSSPTDTNDAA